MKDTIKSPSLDTGIDITKMHGHMDIYLTDVKTGKVEEVHEDNMMTNALQEYFRNCGFLNYPNVNQDNMVVELLGGVMGFSEEIAENAANIHVPAGNKMIFNGSIGTLNNSAPTELGSYSADESGWQSDGSYVQTYDFSTSQANGTISCVCLTGRNYAYAGEGNTTSLVRHSNKVSITDLQGSLTSYSGIDGTIFNISLTDSSCYAFSIEDVEDEGETVKKGFVRKWRLPISKINIKGTHTAPVMLSETEVTLDSDLLDNLPDSTNRKLIFTQPLGSNLLIWNGHYSGRPVPIWGDTFTQYLWTLTPSGTLTKQTLINTTGESNLPGIQAAYFDEKYCYFIWMQGVRASYGDNFVDDRVIYVLNRTTGNTSIIQNPVGEYREDIVWYDRNGLRLIDWVLISGSGDGRILTGGKYKGCKSIDAVSEVCAPTNAQTRDYNFYYPVQGLIRSNGINLYRDQSYIASINNLDNPVVKTAEKTMKVIYRITFDEQ